MSQRQGRFDRLLIPLTFIFYFGNLVSILLLSILKLSHLFRCLLGLALQLVLQCRLLL